MITHLEQPHPGDRAPCPIKTCKRALKLNENSDIHPELSRANCSKNRHRFAIREDPAVPHRCAANDSPGLYANVGDAWGELVMPCNIIALDLKSFVIVSMFFGSKLTSCA